MTLYTKLNQRPQTFKKFTGMSLQHFNDILRQMEPLWNSRVIAPKIKKGDNVIIIVGRDKGKNGEVLLFSPKINKLKVKGLNIVKKSVKADPRAGKPGGFVEKEAFIHVSNVALLNPVSGKPDRVKMVKNPEGKMVRYYKSNDEVVDI